MFKGITTLRKHRTTLVAGGVIALVLGGGAYAAIPAADGTITACANPDGTNLRLLDTATTSTCPAGQNKISWNQKGQGFTHRGTYDLAKDKAGGYKTGDVVTMTTCWEDHDRTGNGTYVRVTDTHWTSNSLPCMYYRFQPRDHADWKQIATNGSRGPTGLRGPEGAAGPSHVFWAKFDANGNFITANAPTTYTWGNANGQALVQFTNVDPRKCAITVTAVDSGTNISGTNATTRSTTTSTSTPAPSGGRPSSRARSTSS